MQILEMLKKSSYTAKQLADIFECDLREIIEDLEHVFKTAKMLGLRMVAQSAQCNSCGFVFKEREKLRTPSKCPECRSEDIKEPVFRIK